MEVSVKEMLEAGAHFGHQTRHWHPAMKPYIFGAKNGIHIIDLQKTLPLCQEACRFLTQVVSEGGEVLLVGTKKQAQAIIEEEAKRSQMFSVSRRWLGGTLTNYRTIKASIERLKNLEKKQQEGGFEGLTKKEKLGIEKEIVKLTRVLGGIKEMVRMPAAVFIVDPHHEHIAQQEANRMGIPVVALADTNCNPAGVDYLIPGNDDAIRSVRLFVHKVADACLEGLELRQSVMREKANESNVTELPREMRIGEKGKAYVSRADTYEEKVEGGFTLEQAEKESKKDGGVA